MAKNYKKILSKRDKNWYELGMVGGLLDFNYYWENFYPEMDQLYEGKFRPQRPKSHIIVS